MTNPSQNTDEKQVPPSREDSTNATESKGKFSTPQQQPGRLLSYLSVIATVAAAIAALFSTVAAYKALTISESQLDLAALLHEKEMKRIAFHFSFSNKGNWSVEVKQISGQTVDFPSMVDVIPIFIDKIGQTHEGSEVSVSAAPSHTLHKQDIKYSILDIEHEICNAQPNACSEWEISAIEIHYKILGDERAEELR